VVWASSSRIADPFVQAGEAGRRFVSGEVNKGWSRSQNGCVMSAACMITNAKLSQAVGGMLIILYGRKLLILWMSC
jgi:hypothetical protein